MGRTLRVFGAAAVMVGGSLATAVPSAAEPSAAIDDITLEECDIIVTFTVGDPGQYDVEVWDDSEQIGDVPVTAEEAGETVQGRYTITAVVKQGASGLGIIVASPDGTTQYDEIDPYNGADHIVDFCRSLDTTPEPTTEPQAPPPTTPAVSNTPTATAPPATPVVRDPGYTG